MIGTKPDSPTAWIDYLEGKLHTQSARGRHYARYYDSEDKTLAFAQEKFREHFGALFTGWRDNFAPLIVDSISERLTVQGFRMGEDGEADPDALDIWQRSFLDAEANAAHIDALVYGSAYLVVWPGDDNEPLITPESAEHVVVQHTAGSRRKLDAAMKCFRDDWGVQHTTLWLPDGVYTSSRGEPGTEWSEPERTPNPFKAVPVVPLYNRRRLRPDPFSELAALTPLLDAISKVAADSIVASEFAAFPQRILTNLEPFEEGSEAAEREQAQMVRAYIDRILTFDGDVKASEFAAADLSNYVSLINMLVEHLAAQSRVPFTYFLLNNGTVPSGEGIAASEAGLVAKAKERMLHFGESWETALRLAFEIKGDKRAKAFDAETIWADPEHRSKAAQVDSLLKLKELGVPEAQLQEDYGYSPQVISRFEEMKEAELKRQAEWDKKYAPQPVGPDGKPLPANGAATATSLPKSAETERRKEKEKKELRAA
ncbi:phage portal protein [Spirillospora sp. NPDC127200]